MLRRWYFMLALAPAAVVPVTTHAQTFRGVVVDDSTKRPLENATVSLLDVDGRDMGRSARTDSTGRYVLHIGVTGTYRIRAVRLGYQPLASDATRFFGGEAVGLDFAMSVVPQRLGTVVVTERRRLNRDDLLSTVGFDLRRSRGVGLFLDTTDLSQFRRMPIGYVMEDHGTVPQIFMRETGAWMIRGMIRGRIDQCRAQIFIDGWKYQEDRGAVRLLGLGADEIHGVEIYSRTLLPPPSLGAEIGDYQGASFSQKCGAVAVWTKRYHADLLAREKKKERPPTSRWSPIGPTWQ
jgi:hypothetical protein